MPKGCHSHTPYPSLSVSKHIRTCEYSAGMRSRALLQDFAKRRSYAIAGSHL